MHTIIGRRVVTTIAVALSLAGVGHGQPENRIGLPTTVQADIDRAVIDTLAHAGAPSASVAVVRDGRIVFTRAYGDARIEPRLPATPDMRYSVGSISKQFTATAILLLAEEGKLSLNDKVARFLPDLTRANDVTIRQILSMTSGYQDYWPQDYVMPPMLKPTTARAILDGWAKKPLDFEPGSRWQYSNTNYVAAGVIVEKASGMPLLDFLQQRVFAPLRMTSVTNVDAAPLGEGEPARYLRYAVGPLRPAPKEGPGWLFAAGELAMTPSDLARWDVGVIDQKVLAPRSYREQQTNVLLTNGVATGYGLGVDVDVVRGHRRIWHNGEVSGFTAQNNIYPDDRAAVVVCVNLDATNAVSTIAGKIASALFASSDQASDRATEQARRIFEGLQHGRIDRALLTENANAYFTDQALADFASSLGPLGTPASFVAAGEGLRGGMTLRVFDIRFAARTLRLTTFTMPDGKLEQYQIAAAE